MVKVSASQPQDRGFEPHMDHDHYSIKIKYKTIKTNKKISKLKCQNQAA